MARTTIRPAVVVITVFSAAMAVAIIVIIANLFVASSRNIPPVARDDSVAAPSPITLLGTEEASIKVDAAKELDRAGASVRIAVASDPQSGECIVVSSQGKAISSARAFVQSGEDRNARGDAVGTSDPRGLLRISSVADVQRGARLIVYKPGYQVGLFVNGGTVVLQEGCTLQGVAISRDDHPVAGLQVFVSRVSLPGNLSNNPWEEGVPGVGRTGVFKAVSSSDGRFSIRGLAPGEYCFECQHPDMCVVDAGLNGKAIVVLPCAPIVVRMAEIMAARVKVKGAEIDTLCMSYPRWIASGALPSRSVARALQLRRLKAGWGKDHAEYFMASGDSMPRNPEASFVLFCRGRGAVAVDVPVKPIQENYVHEIDVSAQVHERGGYASVTIVDATERVLEGLSVTLSRIVDSTGPHVIRESHVVASGSRAYLTHGTYSVECTPQMLDRAIHPREVAIDEEQQEVRIVCDQVLSRVRCVCQDFKEGECNVQIKGEERWQRASSFVRSGEDAIVWLPPGAYVGSVERFGYESRSVPIVVAGDGAEVFVDILKLSVK